MALLSPGAGMRPVRLKAALAHIDRRVRAELEESGQAAAVVVMRVGDDGKFAFCEVDARAAGVFDIAVAGTQVEEEAPRAGLDIEAQPCAQA